MGAEGGVWRVVGRDGTVGEITVDGSGDFPWLGGRFTPGPAHDAVKPLFERELALLERIDEDPEAWEAARAEVERAVDLVSPQGPVAEFLLHVDGDRAWFRWSDEPFSGG
ncbi:hypothetical protein GCM10010406_07240 [Streptomyces thermolineatus]|uniref:Uncharacterized protein n=1 Tax=Streptomyces thermolineatus TaxID=44033 RepID=A0ABP5Y588_9ACTN